MRKTQSEMNRDSIKNKLMHNLRRKQTFIHVDDEDAFNEFISSLRATQAALADAKNNRGELR